ncbi:unnamed protein product [Candida parapsilosis]
MREGS